MVNWSSKTPAVRVAGRGLLVRWTIRSFGMCFLLASPACQLRQDRGSAASERTTTPPGTSEAAEVAAVPAKNALAPERGTPSESLTGGSSLMAQGGAPGSLPILQAPEPALEGPPLPEDARLYIFGGGQPANALRGVVDEVLARGNLDLVELVVALGRGLERLESTNAGRGSALRLDGTTIECDALVQDGSGRQGRALGLRKVAEPLAVADALYRAGGLSVRGMAADELALSLGLPEGELLTAGATSAYERDLASFAKTGGLADSLLTLYVDRKVLSRALTRDLPSPPQEFVGRLPIFVLGMKGTGEATESAIAVSTGGTPLDRPGAPSLLDAPSQSLGLQKASAAVVISAGERCSLAAQEISLELGDVLSLDASSERFEKECGSSHYLLVSDSGMRTSLPDKVLLQLGTSPPGPGSPLPAPPTAVASSSGRVNSPPRAVPLVVSKAQTSPRPTKDALPPPATIKPSPSTETASPVQVSPKKGAESTP